MFLSHTLITEIRISSLVDGQLPIPFLASSQTFDHVLHSVIPDPRTLSPPFCKAAPNTEPRIMHPPTPGQIRQSCLKYLTQILVGLFFPYAYPLTDPFTGWIEASSPNAYILFVLAWMIPPARDFSVFHRFDLMDRCRRPRSVHALGGDIARVRFRGVLPLTYISAMHSLVGEAGEIIGAGTFPIQVALALRPPPSKFHRERGDPGDGRGVFEAIPLSLNRH